MKKSYFIQSIGQIRTKPFWYMVLYEALFFICLVAVIALFTRTLSYNVLPLKETEDSMLRIQSIIEDPSNEFDPLKGQFNQDIVGIRNAISELIMKSIFMFIICVVLFAAISGLFKGKVYSILLNKRFNKKYFISFSLSTFTWFILWLFILLLTMFTIKPPYNSNLLIVELFIIILTSPMFFIFAKQGNPFTMLKNYLRLLLWAYKFIIPIILVVLVYVFFFNVILLLTISVVYIMLLLMIILTLVVEVWGKYYMYLVAKSVSDVL